MIKTDCIYYHKNIEGCYRHILNFNCNDCPDYEEVIKLG
jgi:hypothetical protein